jgi:hypothetical protein
MPIESTAAHSVIVVGPLGFTNRHGLKRLSIRSVFLYPSADLYKDGVMRSHIVLLTLAAVIGLATPAHADPNPDANFLGALNKAGITYNDGPAAIASARRACELMDQGNSQADVIKSMTQENSGFTDDGAARFTQISESVFCPQHAFGIVPKPPQPAWQPIIDFPLPPLPAAF